MAGLVLVATTPAVAGTVDRPELPPGMGHQYPPEPLWTLAIDEIDAHTAR